MQRQLSGRAPLPEQLPLTGGVERAFLDRYRRLPEAAQRFLLIASADDTARLPVVRDAADRLDAGDDALDAVEQAGLLRVDGDVVTLYHPLVRSAVYRAATSAQRRARRRVDARAHLRTALEVFEDLGAMRWATRATQELRASGETARRRDVTTATQLTAQERQVATLVRQGLSNRDAAAQLFLSPRTVDFHLRNVFNKLGLSSRAELTALQLG